jgi:hypothetical protein
MGDGLGVGFYGYIVFSAKGTTCLSSIGGSEGSLSSTETF